jgi:diguanylate cyclase (GGDEF)-like protein/PAS domain S-box-containing protein
MTDAAYLVMSSSGHILACNEAAVRQTGYSKDELIGKDIGEDLEIQDPDISVTAVTKRILAQESVRFIDRKRRKNGTLYWDEVVLIPFRSKAEPVHVSLNRDITDRIQKEADLRESEIRYRSIFESTTDAVLVFDREGVIVEANPNAYRMYEYEPGELIGLPANEVIHPDYFHGFSNFRTAIDDSGHFLSRSVNLRKDGTPFDIEVHGGRFSFQGSPHLLAIVRDIRGQVKAERSLAADRLKIERLHEAASRLAESEAEEDVYRLAVDSAQEILEFSLCSLDIAEEGRLVVKAMSEGLPPEASTGSDLSEESVASTTYRTGQTIVFGSLDEVPEARPTQTDLKSGISAPVGSFGVFQVASRETDAFSEQDVRLLELLLRHTAQAIERIRLQSELVRQANHDPLTGVYNRRYFNQVIEQELARSKRHERTIGFLMIDVNRFKEINDRFGHQTGDKILRDVANLLKDAVRESDLVVRYGGDEFLIVLMEAAGECEMVKDRILAAVAKRNETNKLIPFPVTLSIGGAQWDPLDNLSIETVLAEADRRMYAVKQQLNGK